ncbi:MAG: hypothetical protein AAFU53_17950, partial [Cyanobacteria bacterium J06632_3]
LSVAGWSISRWLAALTTPLNIFLLLPDALLFVLRWWRRPRRFVVFCMGSLFTVAAMLPTLSSQVAGGAAKEFFESQVVHYSKPGILQIFGMVSQLSSLWPLRFFLESQFQNDLAKNELSDTSLLNYFLQSLNGPLIFYAVMILTVLGVFLLAVGQMAFDNTQKRFAFVTLSAWALLPAGLVLLLSYVSGSLWFPRYLLGFAPYAILLLAAGFIRLWHWRRLSWAIGAGYVCSLGISLTNYYGPIPYRNDWQTASAVIAQLEQPGDKIIYYAPPRYYKYSFPRYYQGDNDITLVTRPREADALAVEHIRENLSGVMPVESRFWVVCWWLCSNRDASDQAAVDNIASTLGGDAVVLAGRIQLDSLGNYPIRIYLFTPAAQPTRADGSVQ